MNHGQNPTITVTDQGNLRIEIPLRFKRKYGRKLILMPEVLDGANSAAHTGAQEVIITALARAFAWSELLERNEVASISDLACRLGVNSSLSWTQKRSWTPTRTRKEIR